VKLVELISNLEGENLLGMEPRGVTVHVTESRGLELASEVTPRQIGETTPVMTNFS